MQFEIEEDPVSACLYLSYDIRSLGVKQLHSYLDKRLSFREPVKKSKRPFPVREIAGYYHVLTHCALLL